MRVAGQNWVPDPTVVPALEVPPLAFYMGKKSLLPEAAFVLFTLIAQILLEFPDNM